MVDVTLTPFRILSRRIYSDRSWNKTEHELNHSGSIEDGLEPKPSARWLWLAIRRQSPHAQPSSNSLGQDAGNSLAAPADSDVIGTGSNRVRPLGLKLN